MNSTRVGGRLPLAEVVILAFIAIHAAAQVPIRTGPGSTPLPRPTKKEPCWQVAGVSQAAMHERRALTRQTRQEVEAVCANSTLSVQQKRLQIQQIHQRERQQLDSIITPAQRDAMRSCQASRGGGGHLGGGHGGGPCADMAGGKNGHPFQEEDEASPSDTQKPPR